MPETGTIVGGYRIEGVLGRGGMGVVYTATQLSLERTVALKVLAPELGQDVSFRERFRREGLIQAGIDHPNIVTVYEAGEDEEGLFLAMRLVKGPNFKDMIISRELDAGRALRILAQIADALDTAHEAGLVHRDIKPQNILVSGRDHAFLGDFGLTKGAGTDSLTKTGQFVGTFDYISPEQIRGDPATKASDIYAFGAVLYESMSGVVPYARDSRAAVLYAHLSDSPPKVTEDRPELPERLDEVIQHGMAKDPEDRPESAIDLIEEATEAFSKKARAAMKLPGPFERPAEIGIRSPEGEVPTREAGKQDSDQLAATAAAAAAAPETEVGKKEPQETKIASKEEVQETKIAAKKEAQETKAAEKEVQETKIAAAGETAISQQPPEVEEVEEVAEEPEGAGVEAEEAGRTRVAASVPAATAAGAAATAAAPTAAPPAAPPAKPKTAGRPAPALLAGGAVAVLALAVVGFLVGNSGGGSKDETVSLSRTAATGTLKLRYPSDWKEKSSAQPVQGITFQNPVEVGPSGGKGGVVFGQVKTAGSYLLPAGFLATLPKPPSQDETVKLGPLEAFQYANLKPKGSSAPLTVYAAATSDGVATIACVAGSSGASAFFDQCGAVANSLRLDGAQPQSLGPDDKYAGDVSDAVGNVNSKASAGQKKLTKAKSSAAQAKALKQVAAAYASGASSLAQAEPPLRAATVNASIVSAMRAVKGAYAKAAAAAKANSKKGYSKAGDAVSSAQAKLSKRLASLEELGYSVG